MNSEEFIGAVAHFKEHGFTVMPKLLDPQADLRPVMDEYEALLDQLAADWLRDGTISNYDRRQPTAERLLQVISETDGRCYQPFDISLPLDEDIRPDTPMHLGPAVFNLLKNPRLLEVVEMLIGPEIYSNPVQHMRLKPPERCLSSDKHGQTLISRTFWHQDLAVISEEADQSEVLSVWLPMLDATEANGCMVVVPGSHKSGLLHHCRSSRHNGILESSVGEQRLPVPVQAGDVVFFHKLTVHASLPNVSDILRWSFDLRYNPVGQPTGRPWFPGFIARSRAHPELELIDWKEWRDLWYQARSRLAGKERPRYNRWDPDDPLCA